MGNLRKNLFDDVALPAILALLMAGIGIAALLFWSVNRTDEVSSDRQKKLVEHALEQSISQLAMEQETVTLSDAAAGVFSQPAWEQKDLPAEERAKLLKSTDEHVGIYMYRLFGHDENYILNDSDKPLYAMREGRRAAPTDYELIAAVANPAVFRLRAIMRRIHHRPITKNSPVIADIAMLNGHLAILSVKPMVSHTGQIVQIPGKEPVFVSVQRLDGEFVGHLVDRLLLRGARFSVRNDSRSPETSAPFFSPLTGRTVGYFIWEPYKPGSLVLKDILFALAAGLLVVWMVTHFLIMKVRKSASQLQASEIQARHLAFHDVLTGLPNRALFDDRLDRALAAARRNENGYVALLYLDLDRFKKVNDTLGHPAGDELIREVADRLSNVVRASDTVARLGGDEFAIIQTAVQSEEDITRVCERAIEVIGAPFDLIGSQVFVGVTIGIARSGIDGFDRMELSRKADIALYDAKAAGRGRYTIFAESMDATLRIRRMIENDLREALDKGDQLRVVYQPKYAADSKALQGVEALVRWQHPTKGLLAPAMFIPIAEETGLIERLGEWVLEEACAASLPWDLDAISINFSAVQLRNPLFAERVLEILKKTGFDPARLELEITETSLLEGAELYVPNLKILRAAGVRIVLDDFGTGYSSLSHLRAFEVDRIKIDRSFTMAINSPNDSNAIIRAIVDLAHSSGIQITAEGVETAGQSEFLCSAGCDELQGFLMSRPLSLKDMDSLLGVDPMARQQGQPPRLAA